MNKITVLDVFTPSECESITDEVLNLDPYMVDRGHFWTLGAAAYVDTPLLYPAMANAFNDVLDKSFSLMYARVYEALSVNFGLPVGRFTHGLAMPSFHIFDEKSNGHEAHPHIDEPFTRVNFCGLEWSKPFSFTLPVCMPTAGAGVDFWFGTTDADLAYRYAIKDRIPDPDYVPYELGKMYLHDGMTPHRIASKGDIPEGESRITLQGHGVHVAGGILVYL
jgi:hypothetical protein